MLFQNLSNKIEGGMFSRPDVCKNFTFEEFKEKMTLVKRNAWQPFREVIDNFLGVSTIIGNLLKCNKKLG